MTDLLDPKPGDRVLEVGTGSGYQRRSSPSSWESPHDRDRRAARKARHPTSQRAGVQKCRCAYRRRLRRLARRGPFDAIIVTAAPAAIPQPLVDQLRPGGRMVIPVGDHRRCSISSSWKTIGRPHDDETHPAGEVRASHQRSGNETVAPRSWQNSGYERLLAEQALFDLQSSPPLGDEYRAGRKKILDRYPLKPEVRTAVELDDVAFLASRVNPYLLRFYFVVAGMSEADFLKKVRTAGADARGEVEPWLDWSECSPRAMRPLSSALEGRQARESEGTHQLAHRARQRIKAARPDVLIEIAPITG